MKNYASMNRRRGFTVVEMLVVIGILVVVSLGVATIFQSVGETVSRGRKLSELNQFAARLERVMRDDFEQMTRDGFLVIINKNASYGRDIQLYRDASTNDDPFSNSGRPRRSDEIMFFARGNFVSQRRAIAPEMIATSNEASIYYGHGQKRRADLSTDRLGPRPFNPVFDGNYNYFFNPQPWDTNFDLLADSRVGAHTTGVVNPNEFARDWSLLRLVTLMTNPQGAGQQLPNELFGYERDIAIERRHLLDSPRQVMLQPAARSIFKSLGATGNSAIPESLYDQSQSLSSFPLPQSHSYFTRTSGMVDIVAQDLSSVRTELQALAVGSAPGFTRPSNFLPTFDVYARSPRPAPNDVNQTRDTFEAVFYEDSVTLPNPSDPLRPSPNGLELGRYNNAGVWLTTTPNYDPNDVQRMREWMIDALPSAWIPQSVLDHDALVSGVRYEDIPTRLLFNEDEFNSAPNPELARAYAEANQEMLNSSVFVPRCTEFIVEWSFGFVNHAITDPSNPGFKQLLWYGLDRLIDANGDGVLDPADDRFAARAYAPRGGALAGQDPSSGTLTNRERGPATQLVVGRPFQFADITNPDVIEAACFGFSTLPSADVNGVPSAGAYWPWPKLIRITMTLGDPTDRDVEETYQIIFEVPEPE